MYLAYGRSSVSAILDVMNSGYAEVKSSASIIIQDQMT